MSKKLIVYESVEVMEKIFKTLVVLCAAFYSISCTMPVLACSQENVGSTTGSACSIKELNNLEKSRQEKGHGMFSSEPKGVKVERNLRPVNSGLNMTKSGQDSGLNNCLFGMCLQKTLLGK